MLQAGIKTRVILRQSDILPLSYCHLSVSEVIFKVYIHIYAISFRSAQFMRRVLHFRRQFFTRVLNPKGWGHIYIVIPRQTVSLYHSSSVWLDTRDASKIYTYIMIIRILYIHMRLHHRKKWQTVASVL